jgi:Methyltransferase domain
LEWKSCLCRFIGFGFKQIDKEYSKQYNVDEVIQIEKADIGDYKIKPNEFDFIVAVSTLEHVKSEEVFNEVLHQMAAGTKNNGVNCLIVNSDVQEIDLETNEKLNALMELNLSTVVIITAIRMYHFCHIIYQRLPRYLPLAAYVFTNGGNVKKVRIYNVKDFER